jgi:tRNA(Ile)-lysidine synthase
MLKLKKNIKLLHKIENFFFIKGFFKSNQSLLLTISGGQDSIFLLFLFLHLHKKWNLQLNFLFCNHLWQKDSFYTTIHIMRIVYILKIPCFFILNTKKIKTEEKARSWRYLNFYRILYFYKYNIIFTGHTSSDQIETIFLNILRGCGTHGIYALNWRRFLLNKKYKNIFSDKKRLKNFDFYIFNQNKMKTLIFYDIWTCFKTKNVYY